MRWLSPSPLAMSSKTCSGLMTISSASPATKTPRCMNKYRALSLVLLATYTCPKGNGKLQTLLVATGVGHLQATPVNPTQSANECLDMEKATHLKVFMHWQLPVLWVEKVVNLFIVNLQIRDSEKKLPVHALQD